jgi:hypothetical protein
VATITITAAGSGFNPPTKTFTLTDAVMQDLTDAYQSDANVSVNGTATRAQVLNYITETWKQQIKDKIKTFKTVPAVVPPDPIVT